MATIMGAPLSTDAEGTAANQVRSDRVALLYRQSFPAVFISLVVATILGVLLLPAADPVAVGIWMAVLVATTLARVALFIAYRTKAPEGLALLDWERPYFVSLLASTLAWGLGSLWIVPRDSLVHQTMALVILVGMAGGALSVYSAIRWLAMVTIVIVLLPTTLWVATHGGWPGTLLAMAVILFCLSALRATTVLSHALQQNFEMTHALRRAKEDAERIASIDSLTGLTNRRAFLERAEAPFQFCRRNGLPISAIILDLDHFKQVNDTRGHAAGDVALRHVGKHIESSLRISDMSCRWGGEEFVTLLPGSSLEEAAWVAEKLRSTIAAMPVPASGGNFSITASLGVAEGQATLDALVHRADLALYRAKRRGRNCVASDEGGGEEPLDRSAV